MIILSTINLKYIFYKIADDKPDVGVWDSDLWLNLFIPFPLSKIIIKY